MAKLLKQDVMLVLGTVWLLVAVVGVIKGEIAWAATCGGVSLLLLVAAGLNRRVWRRH